MDTPDQSADQAEFERNFVQPAAAVATDDDAAKAEFERNFGGGAQTETAEALPKTSATGAVLRAAGEGVTPTAAAAAAFLPSSAVGGGPETPVGLVAGIIGAAVAGGSAAWAQHKVAKAIAPEATDNFDKLSEADQEQHPVAGALGRIAAALPMFELSPLQTAKGVAAIYKAARGAVLTDVEKTAAQSAALQVGIGTGTAVVQPLLMGDSPTKQGIAEAFVQSLVLGHPRYGIFGKQAHAAILADETAKDAAATNPVENPASTYQAPPTLTAEQRTDLSLLAAKVTSNAPLDAADVATKAKLVTGNDDGAKYFEEEKQRWANDKMQRLAAAALQRDPAIGDAKTITEGDGGEMPGSTGALEGGLAKPAAVAPPVENQVAIPRVQSEPGQPAESSTPFQYGRQPDGSWVPHPGLPKAAEANPVLPPAPVAEVANVGSLPAKVESLPPSNVESLPTPAPPAATVPSSDPSPILTRFNAALESGAGQLVPQEKGKGKKGGALFDEIKPGETPKQFTERLDTAATNGNKSISPTLMAMSSPDGSHVRVSTFYRNNGEEYVSTASGKGMKLSAALDGGWKILGAMKGEPTKGHAETYSPDGWQKAASAMREAVNHAKGRAEAVADTLSQAKDWDRADANGDHPANDHPTGDDVVEKNAGATTADAPLPHFDTPHAEAIWDILDQHQPKSANDVRSALVQERAFGAVDPLIRDLGLDPKKQTAEEIVGTVTRKIYEHYSGAGKNAEGFAKSILSEINQQVSGRSESQRADAESVRSPNPEPATAPAGGEPGAGGVEKGTGPNAKANAATADAARVKPPKIEVVDKDGLKASEQKAIKSIATKIAEAADLGDEAIDNILEQGVAVKVDGKPALVYGDEIHLADGSTMPLTADTFADVGKFSAQKAKDTIAQLRPTEARTAEIANTVERSMRAIGIRVDRILEPLAKHFNGQYKEVLNGKGNVQRIITWAVADAHAPSSNNLVALFHEVFHAMFARETPQMQAAAHQAVKDATNEALGIGNFREQVSASVKPGDRAGVEQEGRIAESLARKLVNEGFDPAKAQGFVSQAMRVIKDIYNGALMAIAKVAGYPVSQERAMKYFENRLRMTLAGDSMSWVNYLGGPRMKLPDWDNITDRSAATRNSAISPVTNPLHYLETKEGAPLGVASLNHFIDAIKEQVHQWHLTGNLDGLTDSQIVAKFIKLPEKVGDTDLFTAGATPDKLIADAAKKFSVSADTKLSDLSDLDRQRAAVVTHRLLTAWKAEMDGEMMTNRSAVLSEGHALAQNNNKLVRLTKDYTDIDYMTGESKKGMLDLVKQVGDTTRGIRDVAAQEGTLEQVLRQLDTSIKGEDLPAPYKKALNKVHELLTNPDGESPKVKLSDTLQKLAGMDIDWKNAKPADIAESIRQHYIEEGGTMHNDPHLEQFFRTEQKETSRALLATAIAWGKGNAHAMDLLAIRNDAAETQKAEVNAVLKDLISANKTQLGELRDRIHATFKNLKTRDRMLLIADKIAQLKRTNANLMESIVDKTAKVEFHQTVFDKMVKPQLAELEKQAGISVTTFEVHHGAEVPVPDAKGDITMKRLSLRTELRADMKTGEKPTPTAEVVKWMQQMHDYVNNAANQSHGAKFNEVAAAYQKLHDHFVTADYQNVHGSLLMRMLAPVQEMCFRVGTPTTHRLGQALLNYSANRRSEVRTVMQKGTNYNAALNVARKACGYPDASETTFWNNVVGPALHDLNTNSTRFSGLKSYDARMDARISHMINFMGDVVKTPAAKTAMEKLLRTHVENAEFLVKNGAKLGNLVLDQDGQYKIYRPVLGESLSTDPRALTDLAHNFFTTRMASAWGGDSLKARDVTAAYKHSPDTLRMMLQSRFTPEVWGTWMKWITDNDRPSFYAPAEGGIKSLADRATIQKAYAMSSDPVAFAENLARLHGVNPDAAFVADTFDTIQNHANLLRTMVGDGAEAIDKGSPAPKRFIVDARHLEAAPKEYFEYLMLNQYTMEKIVDAQAFQSAFGRNGEAFRKNLTAAANEQDELATDYSARYAAIQKENPAFNHKQIEAQMKEGAAAGGYDFNAIRNAKVANKASLDSVKDHFNALKSMNNSGNIPELKPWSRLLRTISGWTVSGLGTAITAHSVFLEQPIRLHGLNARSLKMTATSIADFSKVFANVLLQSVGRDVMFESQRMLDMQKAGLFDPLNTNRQRMTSAFMHANTAFHNQGPVGRAVGRAADAGGALLQTDVFAPGARAKALANQAAGKAIAPTFKVFSPFSTLAECIQISSGITWQRHIEGMVLAGANHFAANPDALKDPGFKFTREQVAPWFNADKREFDFLTHQMENYGLSLEQLARDTHANAGTTKPILSETFNRNLSGLVLNEITLESSLTSRMPSLQTKGLGVAMNPFLGWPLQKTYQVLRQLREPNGTMTQKALRSGLTAYLAILPIGMAVSWLRNKFDEEVLGRKQNVSDLGNIHDFKSGLMTALDNASRIGTFGMIGEVGNLFLNDDNVRPITLDNRIFFANTIHSVFNSAQALWHQTVPQLMHGNFDGAAQSATDYQTVIRPLFQALGGNGMLQNLGALNHLLGADDAEARVSNRISVNNYLRVAGKELDMDVRSLNGVMQTATAPNPVKPFIGQMVLAAYANDHDDFNRAYKMALSQAKDEAMRQADTPQELAAARNPEEAQKKVLNAFQAMNPLHIVFKSAKTQAEVQKIMAQLPDSGKASVAQALQLFQHYGAQIGSTRSVYAQERAASPGLNFAVPRMTLDSMRSQAVSFGSGY